MQEQVTAMINCNGGQGTKLKKTRNQVTFHF